jgi:hypothetical protein
MMAKKNIESGMCVLETCESLYIELYLVDLCTFMVGRYKLGVIWLPSLFTLGCHRPLPFFVAKRSNTNTDCLIKD